MNGRQRGPIKQCFFFYNPALNLHSNLPFKNPERLLSPSFWVWFLNQWPQEYCRARLIAPSLFFPLPSFVGVFEYVCIGGFSCFFDCSLTFLFPVLMVMHLDVCAQEDSSVYWFYMPSSSINVFE